MMTIDTFCPICGNPVKLQTQTDRECDGYEGACYDTDTLTGDPNEDILIGCGCDLSKPIMEQWAEYINEYHIYDYKDNMETPHDVVILNSYEIGAIKRLKLVLGDEVFPHKMQVVLNELFKKLPEEFENYYDNASDMEMRMVYGDVYTSGLD